ncbi:hypothetical protein [Streptomyces sp. NPDC059460]
MGRILRVPLFARGRTPHIGQLTVEGRGDARRLTAPGRAVRIAEDVP